MKTQLKVSTRNYKNIICGDLKGNYEAESQEPSILPPSFYLRENTFWMNEDEIAFRFLETSVGFIEIFDEFTTEEWIYYGRLMDTSDLIILIFSDEAKKLKILLIENAMLGEYIPSYICSFTSDFTLFFNYMNRPKGKHFPRYTISSLSGIELFNYFKDQPEIEFNYDIIIGKDANGNITAFRRERRN